MNEAVYARRKRVNALMLGLTAVCAAVSAGVLFAILGYIAWKGASSLSFAFLTNLPKPVGESGGGIANAIVGSAKVVGLAGLIGIPIGVLSGVDLSEYGRGSRFGFAVRYAADVLNGVPSIVIGLFAYALVVVPFKRFSALSGSVALSIILIPIVLRNTEEFLRLVPGTIREGALALGVPRWKVVMFIVLPTAGPRHTDGRPARAVARRGRDGAARLHRVRQPLLGPGHAVSDRDLAPDPVYNYAAISPYEDWHRQAWAAALILMTFVLAINLTARLWLKPSAAAH